MGGPEKRGVDLIYLCARRGCKDTGESEEMAMYNLHVMLGLNGASLSNSDGGRMTLALSTVSPLLYFMPHFDGGGEISSHYDG